MLAWGRLYSYKNHSLVAANRRVLWNDYHLNIWLVIHLNKRNVGKKECSGCNVQCLSLLKFRFYLVRVSWLKTISYHRFYKVLLCICVLYKLLNFFYLCISLHLHLNTVPKNTYLLDRSRNLLYSINLEKSSSSSRNGTRTLPIRASTNATVFLKS